MIISDKNGFDYRLNFSYYNCEDDRISTHCKVEKVIAGHRFNDEGEVIGDGSATCDSRDQFTKSVGRKLALSHALLGIEVTAKEMTSNDTQLDKNERKVIWEGYLSRHLKTKGK